MDTLNAVKFLDIYNKGVLTGCALTSTAASEHIHLKFVRNYLKKKIDLFYKQDFVNYK